MGSEITPALTADDWQDAREIGELQLFVMNTAGIPAHLLPARHGYRHGMMLALANYALPDGHPLKITREDVEALREAGNWFTKWSSDTDTDAERVAFNARGFGLIHVADKLAALLPPEPT